jgi:glycosyltransferase involved in cell wall biosynthesis
MLSSTNTQPLSTLPSRGECWPSSVLLLAPQIYSSDGGIQRYARYLVSALQHVRPGLSLQVLALLDAPATRFRAIGFVLSALNALRRRPQLVLCTHLHLAPLGLLIARLSGAQLWVSLHGIEAWRPLKGIRGFSLRHADRLLAVSRYTISQFLRQLTIDPRKLELLPNTYDANRFTPGPRSESLLTRYNIAFDQPVIFVLTRLGSGDRDKRLDRLIHAMVDLLKTHPDTILLIGGDGDDRLRLQDLSVRLGVHHSVLFPGRLDESELVDHYRLATVFALPSSKEGFGIVFLEALGCGRPVLAGNRDGSRDPLADGRFGLLVDPSASLAEPLRALLDQQGDSLWFQPDTLSSAVAETFGFSAFCGRLDVLLNGAAPTPTVYRQP